MKKFVYGAHLSTFLTTGFASTALHKVATGSTSLTQEQRRNVYIAAATAYDFSGAGYELTVSKLGEDHCAMIEGIFTMVVGPDPTKPSAARSFNCTASDTSQGASIVCASKTAPTTPAPTTTP